MLVFEHKESLQKHLESQKDKSIGFVPTMGALHFGHISLLKQSKRENELSVVSIFVNPTQFDNIEDLHKYPKSLETDLILLKEADCDVVFIPNVSEMYHQNEVAESFDFGGIENEMEGAFRKGHFDGVGTIVKKLFNIIKPAKAYFGEKDFQQLQIIRKLVSIEKLPISIVGCPILREENGLAMSSRNKRLNAKEQSEAQIIYQTLSRVKELYATSSIQKLISFVNETFNKSSLFQLEYFSIANENTLKTMTEKDPNKKPRAFIAVVVNSVRLIDNLPLYE